MNTCLFSQAGCRRQPVPRPEFPAERFGIRPGTGEDLTPAVQSALDTIGAGGGGTLLFGPGEYCFDGAVRLDFSNLGIRGAGDATRLRLRRAQTQLHFSAWLTPALLIAGTNLQGTEKFWGVKSKFPASEERCAGVTNIPMSGDIYEAPFLSTVVRVLGDREFEVEDASPLSAGDFVLFAMRNTDDEGTLLKRMLNRSGEFHALQCGARLAGVTRAASFQFLAEVERVSGNRVRLTSPPPEKPDCAFEPALYAAPLLTGIVIENLALVSDWRGPYLHHGGNRYSQAESKEMDYGWNAVKLFRCAHSIIRNVRIEDYTSGVELVDSRNVTVSGLHIEDTTPHGGHYGVKVYCHAEQNLFEDILLRSYRTHAISCEGNAYGNVFRDFTVVDGDGEMVSEFDLHGFGDLPFAPPGYNLFEKITGIGRITGGGGKFNLPHSGRGNVFRDIEFNLRGDELFYSWIAPDTGEADYLEFPGTVLYSVHDPRRTIRIDGSAADRHDSHLDVTHLNHTL